jgi:hypothetical protein
MCDSQLLTRGGGNKGRVEMSSGGYAIRDGDKRHYVTPAETGHYNLTAGLPPRVI